MPRPIPTPIIHFTPVEHLASIVNHGLVADSAVHEAGKLVTEIGSTGIKDRRTRRQVRISPYGVVADYVPFYFAPCSPMMSAIHHGRVPEYQVGCGMLVYLVTTVEMLRSLGLTLLATDRNAVLDLALFSNDDSKLGTLIDWDLMQAKYWNNTSEEPDRRERRMAECLAHNRVPWQAFNEVVAKSEACATTARATLASLGVTTPVVVRPSWYF
jgi:hypothetical protein